MNVVGCTRAIGPTLTLVLLLLGRPAGTQQSDEPPLALRRLVEQHSVAVRTVDDTKGVLTHGTGILVAEEGDPSSGRYIVATARHVLEPYGKRAARIQARPHKHIKWIECEVLASGKAEDTTTQEDYAFLAIPQNQTDFDPEGDRGVVGLGRSTVLGLIKGDVLWAIGYDKEYDAFDWRSGKVEAIGEQVVKFSGTVREGWSGGALVTRGGLLGMTISRGPSGGGNQSLRCDSLAAAAAKASVPFDLAKPVLTEAFRNCNEQDVLASLCEDPGNRWIALSVDAEETLGYSGRWGTFGADPHRHNLGNSGTWSVRIDAERLFLNLSASAEGVAPLRGGLGEREMLPAADFEVPGHILLAHRGKDATVYLAIPRETCETLAVRLLAARGDADLSKIKLEADVDLLKADVPVLEGKRMPMTVFLKGSEFRFDRTQAFLFRLPEDWVGRPCRLSGRLLGPDAIRRIAAKEDRDGWLRQPIHVVDDETGKEVERIDRSASAPMDHPFSVEFEVQGRAFRLVLEEVDQRQTAQGDGLVLQAPVLHRSDP